MSAHVELPKTFPCYRCGNDNSWSVSWDQAQAFNQERRIEYVCLTCHPDYRPLDSDRLVRTIHLSTELL